MGDHIDGNTAGTAGVTSHGVTVVGIEAVRMGWDGYSVDGDVLHQFSMIFLLDTCGRQPIQIVVQPNLLCCTTILHITIDTQSINSNSSCHFFFRYLLLNE